MKGEIKMWEFAITIGNIIVLITFFKAIIVGSDFIFLIWIKYRKIYTNWYFNREEFKP